MHKQFVEINKNCKKNSTGIHTLKNQLPNVRQHMFIYFFQIDLDNKYVFRFRLFHTAPFKREKTITNQA